MFPGVVASTQIQPRGGIWVSAGKPERCGIEALEISGTHAGWGVSLKNNERSYGQNRTQFWRFRELAEIIPCSKAGMGRIAELQKV
jgi:hypothetical protein